MEQSFVMDKHHQAKLTLLLETTRLSSRQIKVYFQGLSEKLYKEKIPKYKILKKAASTSELKYQ